MDIDLKDKMGIYQIVNLIDGKKYIGSSKNLYNRKSKHIYTLRTNSHRNCYLQRAFNKYGEANFSFEVIEFINTEEELLPREQYYIELYQVCDRDKGYNLIVDATRNIPSKETKLKISLAHQGKTISEETKLKMSLAQKGSKNHNYGKTGYLHPMHGKTHSKESRYRMSQNHADVSGSKNPMYGKHGELHPASKKVICIETGVVYGSMVDIEKITGIKRNNISSCCTGKNKTAGGYHWKYYEG